MAIWEKQMGMVAKASGTLQGRWSVLGAAATQPSAMLRVSKPTHFKHILVCQVLKGFLSDLKATSQFKVK